MAEEAARAETVETAVFGKQVEIFWDGQIGQYLLANTLEEYNSALESLKTCDPSDSKNIMKLQGRIWRAESFKEWLSAAITNGMKALDILEGIDDEIE